MDKLLTTLFRNKISFLFQRKIIFGCVIITYLAPLSEVDGLINIAQEQVPFMFQVGVCELMIGDTVITSTQCDTSDFSFELSIIKAAIDDNIDVLSFLLCINTSPDSADGYGQTAPLFGSCYGRSKAVSLLLEASANPNLQQKDSVTPFIMASWNGHTEIVSLLLKVNANPNLQADDGATPLTKASQNGHADTVSFLLKANANPNLPTDDGATHLFMASQEGHSDIVSLL